MHVFCARVGGCFGGKQERLTEDLVALAVLTTGRPVKFEMTRPEQFFGMTTRHPMRVRVRLGARKDGTLTAIAMDVLSNTGAYGSTGTVVAGQATQRAAMARKEQILALAASKTES